MPSTQITIDEAGKILKEFDRAYRLFYRNSEKYLKLSNRRSNSKHHEYYKQVSSDVKEFVDSSGFSGSWVWGLFLDEQLKKPESKRRFFNVDYIEHFERLIIFYQDHIFVEREQDGNTTYIENSISNQKKSKLKELEKHTAAVNETDDLYDNKDSDYIDDGDLNGKATPKRKIKQASYQKWVIPAAVLALAVLATSIWKFNIFGNEKIVQGVVPCYDTTLPKSTKSRINIVAFKESPTENNAGFAKKLFDRLEKINERDSLRYILQYCDGYSDYKNFYEAQLDSIDTESYKQTGITIPVEYYSPNGKVSSKNNNSKEFDINVNSFGGLHRIWASNTFDETALNLLAYAILTQYATNDRNNVDKINKGISYLNEYLIKHQDFSKSVSVITRRGYLKMRKGDVDGYLKDMKLALSHQPNDDTALRSLTNYYQQNPDKEGLQYFEARMQRSPKSCQPKLEYYLFKAQVNNDFKTLLKEVEEIGKCDRSVLSSIKEVKGIALLNLGRTEEGLGCFEELSKKTGYTGKLNYAYAHYVSGNYRQAQEILFDLKKQSPSGVQGAVVDKINNAIGSSYFRMGDYNKAAQYFKASGAYLALGYVNFIEADFQQALGNTGTHILRNQNDPSGYNQRRVIANTMKNFALAKEDSLFIINQIDKAYFSEGKHLGAFKNIGLDRLLVDNGYRLISHPEQLEN